MKRQREPGRVDAIVVNPYAPKFSDLPREVRRDLVLKAAAKMDARKRSTSSQKSLPFDEADDKTADE